MNHPGRSKSPGKLNLIVTLAALAFAFLLVLVLNGLPGALDRSGPGPVPIAVAEESKQKETASGKEEKPKNDVTVYVTSWCPACTMTTDYLKRKKIPFVVKDVEKNEDYMKEMVRKVGGYRGVPVLDINGRILLGFNPQVLDRLAD